MNHLLTPFVIAILLCRSLLAVAADEASTRPVDAERVSAAIRKAIPLLEKGAAGSATEKKCFTCHSQALPVLALAEARQRGFKIDETVFQSQLQHTAAHLKRGLAGYRKGSGQGGRVLTAGYALWTLEAGDWKSDEVTSAVVHYLLTYQKDDERWHHGGNRPPSSGSDFATTYVALRALKAFGTEVQADESDERLAVVSNWLKKTQPKDTEDQVFRFRALSYLNADEKLIASSRDELINTQQSDGGWAQKSDMTSDAYATGSVLVSLSRYASEGTDAAINRGVKYLLDSQQEDGSWHVVTRAKGFQPYFETGFPHGKDQFISTAATAWSTLALTLTLPQSESQRNQPEKKQ
jgi:hypothetical protein